MKAVIHELGTGRTSVVHTPRPRPAPDEVLIANEVSVVSTGTERMLVSFGNASLLGKLAREPARARKVLAKLATDGLIPTLEAVQAKLGRPIPMGYSAAGIVVEVGDDVQDLAVGARVVSNGPHAELVCVPRRLVAPVPDAVPTELAAVTPIASVALEALRSADVRIGGTVAVIGVGLIGEFVMQLARGYGCRVVGFEPQAGPGDGHCNDPDAFAAAVDAASGGKGANAVIVTANAGGPNDPLRLAESVAAFRGQVVLVGGGDPTLERAAFYEKELTFSVAHSYGDAEQFVEVLDLMAAGRLGLGARTLHLAPVDDAATIYEALQRPSRETIHGFRYGAAPEAGDVVSTEEIPPQKGGTLIVVGAGNYADRILIPAIAAVRTPDAIVSRRGLTAATAAKRHGVTTVASRLAPLLDGGSTVFVATNHDSHADLVVDALRTGANVWVEKPLALSSEALERVAEAWETAPADSVAMVGFNRRFAPTTKALKGRLSGLPKTFVYTVNAPPLPPDHWLLDAERGGGRILGEAIHFVDLLAYLANGELVDLDYRPLDEQSATLNLDFDDGSRGTVHYFCNGAPGVAKERVEVFDAGRVFRIENYRTLREFGTTRTSALGGLLARIARRQDKGQHAAVAAFLEAVERGGDSPVSFDDSLRIHRLLLGALGR